MEPTIKRPKVFISYAWGNEIYKEKVRSFATTLMNNGIDVILDQWNLEEGNDTYKFMEKTVSDTSITNVLILLDKNYTEKANARKGGVGTETQIITPEIYSKTEQTKFIPIIFEKSGGQTYIPTFLSTRKYVDLANDSTYEENLKYLIKLLFGIKIHKKPEIGTMPNWVVQEELPTMKQFVQLNFIDDKTIPLEQRLYKIKQLLFDINNRIANTQFSIKHDNGNINAQSYYQAYKELTVFKTEIFNIISQTSLTPGIEDVLGKFIENMYNEVSLRMTSHVELKYIFIHEMFLSILGHLYQIEKYNSIGDLLTRTYFINENGKITPSSFSRFYCTSNDLDKAINITNKTNKITATGDYWLKTIEPTFCNYENLIFIDLFLNIFSQTKIIDNLEVFWFPKLYIYDAYHTGISNLAIKLKSKREGIKVLQLFNIHSLEQFKTYLTNIEQFAKTKEYVMYGYMDSFTPIPFLTNYIKVEELGMYN